MATFDISLPATKEVIFPPTCVVCEKADPDGEIKLSILGANTQSLTINVASIALNDRTYGSNTNNVVKGIPACKKCSSSLKWYHRILKFATYTAWIPGVLLMVLVPLPTWISITFLLACIVTPVILSMIFPPAFGATFLNGNANFEFKSEKIANEFRRLNEATS